MSTDALDLRQLSDDQRERLGTLVHGYEARIRELGEFLSEVLGQDPNRVRKVTVSYDFGIWDDVAKRRVPDPDGGPTFCTIYDDHTCGCTQDPPGISFRCP